MPIHFPETVKSDLIKAFISSKSLMPRTLINNITSAIIVKNAIVPEISLWILSISSCHSFIIEQITQNIAKKPPKTQDIIHKT